MMKLNDDDVVAWSVKKGQHSACTVSIYRAMLRASFPDWSDDEIEREIFDKLVHHGSS